MEFVESPNAVDYEVVSSTLGSTELFRINVTSSPVAVTALAAATHYNITIVARNGNGQSDPVTVEEFTRESFVLVVGGRCWKSFR